MKLDINSLTLGEVAKVEELSGLSINALSSEEKPKGLALAAVAFVWKRRANPEFTWNQAQAVTLEEANELLGIGDAEPEATEGEGAADPTEAAEPSKHAAKS